MLRCWTGHCKDDGAGFKVQRHWSCGRACPQFRWRMHWRPVQQTDSHGYIVQSSRRWFSSQNFRHVLKMWHFMVLCFLIIVMYSVENESWDSDCQTWQGVLELRGECGSDSSFYGTFMTKEDQTMIQIKVSVKLTFPWSHSLLTPELHIVREISTNKTPLRKVQNLFCGKRKLSLSPPGLTKILSISIIARILTAASTHSHTLTFITLTSLIFLNINHKLSDASSVI